MTSKKFLPVVLLFTGIGIFFTIKTLGNRDREEDPKARHARIIRNVGSMLEEAHFSPRKVDDAFSEKVLAEFEKNLDDERVIFIQSDITSFERYRHQIDDEIKGRSPLESFYVINDVYLKRLKEVSELYKPLLEKPMDFRVDESVQLDPEKHGFPSSLFERQEWWRKRLKYAVLTRYSDLLEEREKARNTDPKSYGKADTTLEREARDQVRKQMDRYFSTKINRENTEDNFSTFVNSITRLMDPHTDYYPPVDARSFNESISGRFYGIGAQLKEEEGKIKISSLVGGGPAWKSGELKENDEIIKVGQGQAEPVDVTGYSVSDAVKLIRGSEKGSEVRLTIRRPDGTIKVVRLIRDDIKLEATFARSAIINGAHRIGYIYLPEFYADFERPNGARCAADVAKELDKLKAEKVDGILLDLRGNGGGSLYDVVQMAGFFIEDGPICQVKGRDDKASILRDRDRNIIYSGPLAVMVDGASASASEIFAAAIQDYNRGLIIGSSSTYGKGTVQRMIPLNPEGELSLISGNRRSDDLGNLKITLQKFYRVNGGATQQRGVNPDIILPDRYDYLKYREKDNESSLPWDEIPSAEYRALPRDPSYAQLIAATREEVTQSPSFSGLANRVEWMRKNNDRAYSLQFDKYKAEQKMLKNVMKEMEDFTRLPQALDMRNLYADTASIQSATDKVELNKQWMKFRLNDLYIEESVKVLDRMIVLQQLAAADIKK